MRILLTGFEPFGGEKANPSKKIIELVNIQGDSFQALTGTHFLFGEILPVTYDEAATKAIKIIKDIQPDVILLLGQAGGRTEITLERLAINIIDGVKPDENNIVYTDREIVPGGQTAYKSGINLKKTRDYLVYNNIPCRISNTAGTFVCNFVYYSVLDYCSANLATAKTCFIHLPYLPEQVLDKENMPFMSFDMMIDALKFVIESL